MPTNGFGHFHKTLGHDQFGEVNAMDWTAFTAATGTSRAAATPALFANIPPGMPVLPVPPGFKNAQLTNPLAGLAIDPLVPPPETFVMPPPPEVTSVGTAAELTELYWMALLRDLPFDQFTFASADLVSAAKELDKVFSQARAEGTLSEGVDLPCGAIHAANVFRLGLPGDDIGPIISQFWLRDIRYGTQTIDQREDPYRRGLNFLTEWKPWLHAQNTGKGPDGSDYPHSNEFSPSLYLEAPKRYISCMRDMARFVNKDALHQAYFNAALQLLNSGAKWTPGSPYSDKNQPRRDAGFGTLGGPHILALVSEVASRALQTIWYQKWQRYLRLRPEAYAGALHVQSIGAPGVGKKPYGLKATGTFGKVARDRIQLLNGGMLQGNKIVGGSLLLPMAFTAGSPAHPSYGAGHATVAGACVTVLKAFFQTLSDDNTFTPLALSTLSGFSTFVPGITVAGDGSLTGIQASGMTIEGELNKLAQNVAMGRSMGGVHWRSDNTRSLILGEAMAAHVLGAISVNLVERPTFVFRTFGRKPDCTPRLVQIAPDPNPNPANKPQALVTIDGVGYHLQDGVGNSLSDLLNPPAGFKA